MATYDYYCAHCGTTVSIQHPMNASPTILCEKCTEPRTKKYSIAGVSFKGNGWGKDA